MRSVIRWILPVLLGVNGAAMILAPVWWYGVVPGVVETGPFNHHFVNDVGAAYLAAAVGLGLWAARKGIGGAVAAAVFLGVHMVVHIADALSGHHPGNDVARDFVGVYLPALLAIWIAWRGWKQEA